VSEKEKGKETEKETLIASIKEWSGHCIEKQSESIGSWNGGGWWWL